MSDNEPRDVDADQLDEPEPLLPDERDSIVALALQRFYGGHAEGEEQ